jgi:predicted dienelactone hydrolase
LPAHDQPSHILRHQFCATNECVASFGMGNLMTMWVAAMAIQATAGNYQPNSGTNAVEIIRSTWHDAVRHRDLSVKLFIPKATSARCPVILFSPGLGSSRENYAYLGEGWGKSGYVCVFLQHPGSDPAIFKDADPSHRAAAMREVLKEPRHILDRAQDISFAIDELARLNRDDSPLQNRLDLSVVGAAGHSYGAGAVMISAGEGVPEVGEKYRDARITAAIAISPPIIHGLKFNDIHLPVFVVTGTEDAGFTRTWIFRHTIYDKIKSDGTCLVVFKGAEHFTFGDPLQPRDHAKTEKFHPLVLAATTAFWDAHLRKNPDARAWLEEGGLTAIMQGGGKFKAER